jgi:hypothetical protein
MKIDSCIIGVLQEYLKKEGSNFTEAIKEFYQVIEADKASPSHLCRYKFLRHGLSHSELRQGA